MLLDLTDPTKILHRSKEPILEPNEEYEIMVLKQALFTLPGP